MTWRIAFDPLLAWYVTALLILAALALAVWSVRARAIWRAIALAVAAIALANPVIVREAREALGDAVVLLVDESESVTAAGRAEAMTGVADALRAKIEALGDVEVVEARVPPGEDETALFAALANARAQAPDARLSAVIAVTDGQVHDAPSAWDAPAPFHAVIVGDRADRDRRLEILEAPQYAIVDEPEVFRVRVHDPGADPDAQLPVQVRLNGRIAAQGVTTPGTELKLNVAPPRRGPNVVEVILEPIEGELTQANNRAALVLNGVRDRLRVLLVTGEPYAGARAWRDLLKSDPAVDLVHFTILRPPDKQDSTPTRELSLIAFPTRELFEERLDSFDLIIFDRYRRRGVLRQAYFQNIARYVENGGALLVLAGEPFADVTSVYLTGLANVLPARPTGAVVAQAFAPAVTELGARHPVTAPFSGDAQYEWGRWFRAIEAEAIGGQTLMTGPDGAPLLVVSRSGQGRVGVVLSDQSWLWSRGVEGGGPFAEVFRRVAHWLMAEPELDEERLSARVQGGELFVEKRTLGEAPGEVAVTGPDGSVSTLALSQDGDGVFTGRAPAASLGLYQIRLGEETAAAAAGPINPRELADLTPSAGPLTDVLLASGGGAVSATNAADAERISVRRTRLGANQSGDDWLGLPRRGASLATQSIRSPLLPAPIVVSLILGLLAFAWFREGR